MARGSPASWRASAVRGGLSLARAQPALANGPFLVVVPSSRRRRRCINCGSSPSIPSAHMPTPAKPSRCARCNEVDRRGVGDVVLVPLPNDVRARCSRSAKRRSAGPPSASPLACNRSTHSGGCCPPGAARLPARAPGASHPHCRSACNPRAFEPSTNPGTLRGRSGAGATLRPLLQGLGNFPQE